MQRAKSFIFLPDRVVPLCFCVVKALRGAVHAIATALTYGKAERFLLLFGSFSFKKKKSIPFQKRFALLIKPPLSEKEA